MNTQQHLFSFILDTLLFLFSIDVSFYHVPKFCIPTNFVHCINSSPLMAPLSPSVFSLQSCFSSTVNHTTDSPKLSLQAWLHIFPFFLFVLSDVRQSLSYRCWGELFMSISHNLLSVCGRKVYLSTWVIRKTMSLTSWLMLLSHFHCLKS